MTPRKPIKYIRTPRGIGQKTPPYGYKTFDQQTGFCTYRDLLMVDDYGVQCDSQRDSNDYNHKRNG